MKNCTLLEIASSADFWISAKTTFKSAYHQRLLSDPCLLFVCPRGLGKLGRAKWSTTFHIIAPIPPRPLSKKHNFNLGKPLKNKSLFRCKPSIVWLLNYFIISRELTSWFPQTCYIETYGFSINEILHGSHWQMIKKF